MEQHCKRGNIRDSIKQQEHDFIARQSVSVRIMCLIFGYIILLVLNYSIKGQAFSSISIPSISTRLVKPTSSSPPEAKELLDLLIKKYHFQTDLEDIGRIEVLMQRLQHLNVPIDPTNSLDGPLFAVLHQTGPKPFWEKRSIDIFGKKNIKGQKYTKRSDGSFDIVNYAQLLGNILSIQGCGVCVQNQEKPSVTNVSNDGSFNFFQSFGNKKKVCCPVDYTVQIQNASIMLFGKQINIDVRGTGYMRILYSDDKLRILTSPKDTSDSTWEEKAGLTVAQVRVDLIMSLDSLNSTC